MNHKGNITMSREELLLFFNRFLNTVDMHEWQSRNQGDRTISLK